MTQEGEKTLRDALWGSLVEAWPYDVGGSCGMCFALVAVEHRAKHAEWHVATMPEDQWQAWCDSTVNGIADLIGSRGGSGADSRGSDPGESELGRAENDSSGGNRE